MVTGARRSGFRRAGQSANKRYARDDSGGGGFLARSVLRRWRQTNRIRAGSDEGPDGCHRTSVYCEEMQYPIPRQATGQLVTRDDWLFWFSIIWIIGFSTMLVWLFLG